MTCIFNLRAKFQLFTMIWSMSITPHPQSPYLEDIEGLCLDIWRMGSFLTSWIVDDFCAKFQLSSMNRSLSRNPHPRSAYLEDVDGSRLDTLRMGHPGHNGSSWHMILDLCVKFQLSSMKRSASRTPHPQSHTCRKLKVSD